MPKRKRSKYYNKLNENRWRNRVSRESNDLLCSNENQMELENEINELPKTSVRIDTKFEEMSQEVNVENGIQYIIFDISQLIQLLKRVKCVDCDGISMTLDAGENSCIGFAHKIVFRCQECEMQGFEAQKCEIYSSKRVTKNHSSHTPFDVNLRLAAAFLYMGKGYSGVQQFCTFMNLHPLSESNFQNYVNTLSSSIDQVTQNILQECRTIARKVHSENNVTENHTLEELEFEIDGEKEDSSDNFVVENEVNDNNCVIEEITNVDMQTEDNEKRENQDIVDIGVSYDGTWLTRGYKSKHGVGCVIDIETGFVIDYDIMTKYCHTCVMAAAELGEDSPEFAVWSEGHAECCNKNHNGSAGAMEVSVAENLWKRSIEYGFRYTKMLSDGDCKTFNHLTSLNVYGADHEISKEECVNHVGKRLFTGLCNIVSEEKARKVTLGGRGYGQLKKSTIQKLTEYYKKAIHRNKNNIDAMRDSILASIYHAVSTDIKPQHFLCPQGSSSWCFFQADKANNKKPRSHNGNIHTPLTQLCFDKILPLYQRLSEDSLLLRCSRCLTQNANESLHSIIWSRCPKEVFVGNSRIKIATCLAICEYNLGTTRTVSEILTKLGLSTGRETVKLSLNCDSRRLARGIEKSSEKFRKARRIIARATNRREASYVENEGIVYGAGMF